MYKVTFTRGIVSEDCRRAYNRWEPRQGGHYIIGQVARGTFNQAQGLSLAN